MVTYFRVEVTGPHVLNFSSPYGIEGIPHIVRDVCVSSYSSGCDVMRVKPRLSLANDIYRQSYFDI